MKNRKLTEQEILVYSLSGIFTVDSHDKNGRAHTLVDLYQCGFVKIKSITLGNGNDHKIMWRVVKDFQVYPEKNGEVRNYTTGKRFRSSGVKAIIERGLPLVVEHIEGHEGTEVILNDV